MKKFLAPLSVVACLVVCLVLILKSEITSPANHKALNFFQDRSPNGFLMACGTVIRDQNGRGKEVLLQGVNLGGALLIEPWLLGITPTDQPLIEDEWGLRNILISRFGEQACRSFLKNFYALYIQTSDIANLRALGLNAVRLPINYRLLQNEDGSWITNASGQIDFDALDRIVSLCANNSIYVLLDLHGAPGSQNEERHSGRAGLARLFSATPEGEKYRERTVGLWRVIAEHYKDNPMVCGYDLLNEPREPTDDISKKALWELYDRLYQAIREVDRHHIIMMEAVWGWDSLPRPAEKNWANVVYQFHYYDVLQNKDPEKQKAFLEEKIREGLLRQAEYQVPVMIGEFTCLNYMSTWSYYLKRFQEAKWSWIFWTYKSREPSGAWGLFNARGNVQDLPRFEADSWDVLLNKLSFYVTADHYSENRTLSELIKRHTAPPES